MPLCGSHPEIFGPHHLNSFRFSTWLIASFVLTLILPNFWWFQYASTACISITLVSQILDLLVSKDFVLHRTSAIHFLLSDPGLVFFNSDLLADHELSEVVISSISFKQQVIGNISMFSICLVHKLGYTLILFNRMQDLLLFIYCKRRKGRLKAGWQAWVGLFWIS